MSWFQLDADSVLKRTQARGCPLEIPGLRTFLQRGILGFMVLSLAGFAPWAVLGRWLHRSAGEGGLYAICAVVFIGLSGPLLHRLILGPGSLPRFYKLFSLSFSSYSILWIAGWMTLRGHVGGLVGLLAGTAAMGWLLTRAFGAAEAKIATMAALFALNAIGYFGGGWIEGMVSGTKSLGSLIGTPTQLMLAKLLWGACYGIGLGAGLGVAFYLCQLRTIAALRNLKARPIETAEQSAN